MALQHNVAATWKDIVVWMNVAGTWKKCALYHNVAGTWKQITFLLSSLMPNFNDYDFAISPSNAFSGLTLNNDGTYTSGSGGSSGTWRGGGASSEYDARLTLTSGALTGGTLATWLNLGTSRTWSCNETRDGYYSSAFTGTLEIRMAASPYTVLSTTTVTLQADVEV